MAITLLWSSKHGLIGHTAIDVYKMLMHTVVGGSNAHSESVEWVGMRTQSSKADLLPKKGGDTVVRQI